jgi:hypothetical protein
VINIMPEGTCMTTLLNVESGLVCASGVCIMPGERDPNILLPRAIDKIEPDIFPNVTNSSLASVRATD